MNNFLESINDSEIKTIIKKDYLAIARNCWDAVKNIHYLPPAVYGMKVSYEHKIKELKMESQRRIDNDTH
jgi:hypothetical protein